MIVFCSGNPGNKWSSGSSKDTTSLFAHDIYDHHCPTAESRDFRGRTNTLSCEGQESGFLHCLPFFSRYL